MTGESTVTSTHSTEVEAGARFEFGKNWSRFLTLLNDDRIARAEKSLVEYLEIEDLRGKSFLDIGSGSGLFSLAARRLGARVHSLDYDPNSVGCTMELRRRFFPGDTNWVVEEGSALDTAYIRSLGQFDVVYSWGVLHHTGNMWLGMENAVAAVAPGGRLFIAIYNDTGTQAVRWRWIKQTYNRIPRILRPAFAALVSAPEESKALLRALAKGKPSQYAHIWWSKDDARGMSHWHDIVDWVGGYPYEVATPDEIFDFCKARGFTLTRLMCGNVGLGCAQFVFSKA